MDARTISRRYALLALLLAAVWSAPSHAQVGELEAHAEGQAVFHAEAGLFWDGDFVGVNELSAVHFGPAVRLFYPLRDNLLLSADWGLTFISLDAGDADESSFRSGNLFVGAHYVRHQPMLRFRVGGGLALPLANIPDNSDAPEVVVNYALAAATRGLWDVWLWAPETLSLVVPARVEIPLDVAMEVAIDGALAIAFAVADNERDTELLIQSGGELAFLLSPALRLAFRLQFDWLLTDGDHLLSGNDNFQLSFEPVFRGNVGRGYLQARMVLNIDEPWGFAFDDDGVWGLMLGGGLRF